MGRCTRALRLLPLCVSLAAATTSSLALASSDEDVCEASWSLYKPAFDACNNLAMLSPGNDNRVNLRLLLADAGLLPLRVQPPAEFEVMEGYADVPFDVRRLDQATVNPLDTTPPDLGKPPVRPLQAKAAALGATLADGASAGEGYLNGEGSRCRSNNDSSAEAFLDQLAASKNLSQVERQRLATSRLTLLGSCQSEPGSFADKALQSVEAIQFGTYLQAAADFYSGRFDTAAAGFASLGQSEQPWLKATALYMQARTALNLAQQNSLDSEGLFTDTPADPKALQSAQTFFEQYLQAYPSGEYAGSAQGLLRRVHWLGDQPQALADDFLLALDPAHAQRLNVSTDELIDEADTKLLSGFDNSGVRTPTILAVMDLMGMRARDASEKHPAFTLASLEAQKTAFATRPELFSFLQASVQFYLNHSPDEALKLLPTALPTQLDYLAFSQQTLRGMALEAKGDFAAASQLWLGLLPLAQQPLQHAQLELALAMNYEQSNQLDKVFAADSPVVTRPIRSQLLDYTASAELLRTQAKGSKVVGEADLALFVLLYKELLHSQYQAFGEDLQLVPNPMPTTKLSVPLGFDTVSGLSLGLYGWNGHAAESGYDCPAIAEVAKQLQTDPKAAQGLNCLGEFILRNGLDGMRLDKPPTAPGLASSKSLYKGATELFARQDGYQSVIANPKASANDKAYALYRAINCYAPSGNNTCGGKDVTPAQRKQWFKELKTAHADSQWGKSLKYFW